MSHASKTDPCLEIIKIFSHFDFMGFYVLIGIFSILRLIYNAVNCAKSEGPLILSNATVHANPCHY